MKFSASLLVLSLASLVSAGSSSIGGIAGSIDNSADAATLQSAAEAVEEGSYIFTNAKTGESLHYIREGNHIVPSSSDPSAVSVKQHGGGVPWVRLAIGDKNKCLSSQWGPGGFNLAGVMYSCAVDQGGQVTRLGNTLEPTKQWWLLVPVESYDDGDSSYSTNALFNAQKASVKTREKALGLSKRHFGQAAHGLVARQSRERKSWKDRVAAVQTSSKNVVKKDDSKVVAKTSEATVQKPSTSAASKSSSSTNTDGKRYFIIPTDHLIDMHTLALTGHQIESAGNTQSTALDAWDPTDEQQQWIITLA